MAQNTTTTLPANTWTQLTDADIASATFQNNCGNVIFITGTAGAVAPTSLLGAIRYNPGTGERNVAMSNLFPGVSGANRLYAIAVSGGHCFISHA